jgi:hypothetical protein
MGPSDLSVSVLLSVVDGSSKSSSLSVVFWSDFRGTSFGKISD